MEEWESVHHPQTTDPGSKVKGGLTCTIISELGCEELGPLQSLRKVLPCCSHLPPPG